MKFRSWLEQMCPGYTADNVLDILDAFDLHDMVKVRWRDERDDDEGDRGDRDYQRQIEEEYESGAKEAAREMERIRRSGL